MNAAPPVLQAQPVSEAVQPEAAASAATTSTRAGSQDFAAALSDAGGKPVRKSAANRAPDLSASGSTLPAPGNQPPLAPLPPAAAKTEVPAAAVADAAALAKASQSSAPGPQPPAIATPLTAPANAGGATTILAANLDPEDPSPPEDPLATTAGGAPSVSGSGLSMPHAASLRTLTTTGTEPAAAAPRLLAGSGSATRAIDGTARQGSTTTAADATPPSSNALNDSTLSNAPAAGTDATAQSVMAAAVAQGTSAPAAQSSSSDDGVSPDTGVSQSAAAPSDPTAAAPAAAFARVAAASMAAAATTAAAATAVAQAVSIAGAASAADKRSHGQSPDSTLPGTSSDGSVGAAQLLTSNTSTDSAPTPTFKVAAGVDSAQFGQGVADRVSVMIDSNLTSAKLQVNPPALGPIEVRIALQGGHAQVWLSSHSAVTRDALEASSSKLQEMLGSQGFSQVSVDISQRSFQERLPQSQAYESAPSGDTPVLAQSPVSLSRSASGLLDAYA
jgi:flagellar hook-length control protein FliK